ncbi:hypothetical protein BH11PSE11_BH11PSE11_12270 [soil metagenome]
MKITNITKNPAVAEATATLAHLVQSLADTQAEAERIAAKLVGTEDKQSDIVSTAMDMIRGLAPARNALSVLQTDYAESMSKTTLLTQAIDEQRRTLYLITGEASAAESAKHKAEHARAVRNIADALKAVDAALEVEEGIRSAINQAGYRCILQSFEMPNFGRLNRPESLIAMHYRAAIDYATDHEDDASGKLDQPATVRLLVDMPSFGGAADVVNLDGRTARQLVRAGRAEPTSDKPSRVARMQKYLQEAVFS